MREPVTTMAIPTEHRALHVLHSSFGLVPLRPGQLEDITNVIDASGGALSLLCTMETPEDVQIWLAVLLSFLA